MAVIDDILALIDDGVDADDLLEGTLSVSAPDLHAAAVDDFGSWDGALAAALVYLRRTTSDPGRQRVVEIERDDAPRPDRVVGPDGLVALHVIARSGQLMNMELRDIAATPGPQLEAFPTGPGREHTVDSLIRGIDDPGLVLITDRGNGVAVDSRLLPDWERDAVLRPLHLRFGDFEPDEVIASAFPRRALRDADRLYSVSIYGQIKASDTSEYRKLSSDAMTALLLRDGDALLNVFTGSKRAKVFVGSSAAKAIVFETADIRSQGRKATGVRAIALDPDARVVGAFVTDGEEWVAMSTEQGVMKRMRLDDFRPQGRGGGGLQTCRLSPGDHVASMCAVPLDGDVLVLTNQARIARFPAFEIPYGGRAAKGESCLELLPGEQVTQILGAPAGAWRTD